MGFDTGRVSFRLFYLQQTYDSSLVEAFAQEVVQPISTIKTEPISGWVTGRHLLDRDISDERCVIGPYIHVQLMKAEKKIPNSLLTATVKLEEEGEMRARETAFLPRKVRAEVKQRVIASLQPQMPPTLTGIPVVVDLRNQQLVAGALSDKQVDALKPAFKTVGDSIPIPVTQDNAALKRKRINAVDLDPITFSPDPLIVPPNEPTLGMDFLTWLWFNWENNEGNFHLPDGRPVGYMLEGPITFYREGEGAHEAVLRKGMPLNSREAATALMCGKKLRRAKITVAIDEKAIEATVDADFVFRGVKLPKAEQTEKEGIFEERMMQIETFCDTWFTLYDRFLDMRTDPKAWPQTLAAMQEWIKHVGAAAQELAENG